MNEIFITEGLVEFAYAQVPLNIWMATSKCRKRQKNTNSSGKTLAFLEHIKAQ